MSGRAKCDKEKYTLFLLADPRDAHCTSLSEVMGDMSHDAVNRFLKREEFTGKDLFEENKDHIESIGCHISVDDTVIDKTFSEERYNDLVRQQYSGRTHKTINGIGIITLFCCDNGGKRLPVNFRVYEGEKSKNELFREMMAEVLLWGLRPCIVTGDAWYGSIENLKFLREQKIDWIFALKKNRIVSQKAHDQKQVSEIDIPHEGCEVHLKGYGMVRVFRRDFKDKIPKYYATSITNILPEVFEHHHSRHWIIEQYHRALKQLCNFEKCMLRDVQGQKNHFFCALRAFSFLELQVISKNLSSWYSLAKYLYNDVVKSFILQNLPYPINA